MIASIEDGPAWDMVQWREVVGTETGTVRADHVILATDPMTGTTLKGISDGPPTGQYDLCLVKWRSVVAARVHGVFQQFVGRQYFDFQKKNFQQIPLTSKFYSF